MLTVLPDISNLMCSYKNTRLQVFTNLCNSLTSCMTIEQAKIELETIIDAIKDPIFLHNNELKIIRVNIITSFIMVKGILKV